MKTYTFFLDLIIFALLVLAVHFRLFDSAITESHISRGGITRTTIISWQSLLLIATFCVFLRYIAQKFTVEMEKQEKEEEVQD